MSKGRKPDASRRTFLKYGSLAALAVAIDFTLPVLHPLAAEWVTSANAEPLDKFSIPGKNGLRVLNNRPLNAETLPYLIKINL